MWQVGCAAAALAVAGAVLAAPARAEPGTFVLTGTRSGWVDVTIPGEAELPVAYATIATAGRFGGFYAEQLSSTLGPEYVGRTAGLIALRAVTADGELSRPEPVAAGRLSPGVVRFYLVADGRTTVTFDPSQGLPERTVRPVRRTAATVVATPLRRGGGTWTARAALPLPRRALVAVALRAEGRLTRLADVTFCVTRRGGECADDPTLTRLGARGADGSPAGASYWFGSYHPAYLAGGVARDVRYTVTANAATAVDRAAGVRFVLTLA